MTKQLSFRLPEDLREEIEKRKTDSLNQTDIAIAALRLYFNPPEPVVQCNTDEIQRLTNEIQCLTDEIQKQKDVIQGNTALLDEKDKRIKDLQNQVGFLQYEFSKLDPLINALMPSKEEIKKKKWWQFWKKSKE